MSNLGLGLGSFMSGLQQGYSFSEGVKDQKETRRMRGLQNQQMEQQINDNNEMRGITKQAATDATAARQADISKGVEVGSAEQGGMSVPTYSAGGKQHASKEDAEKEAEKGVGSFMDYYMKTSAPKIMEHWASTGQLDKVQAFGKFMEDEGVKKGVKAWAGAVRSFQLGDSKGFKDNLMKAYNQAGYFDDGYTASNIKDVKNDKGDLLGYAITFKDKDGNETTQNYDGDSVARLGLQAMAPDQVLSYGLDQLKQASAAQAQIAKEQRGFNRDLSKIDYQSAATERGQVNQSQLRRQENAEKIKLGGTNGKVAEATGIANALRAIGKDEAYINNIYPQLLGIERSSRSPSDRLDNYVATMAKSDMDFASLSPSQQVERATQMMNEVDKAKAASAAGKDPEKATGDGKSGHNGAADAKPKPRGIPMRDSKTGQIVYQ